MLEKRFQEFVKYAKAEKLGIEGIAVADETKVLLEHHFLPDLARNIYSHTKSYMATAVGIAIGQGKMKLEDRLADYFPEALPKDPDPRLYKITLRHLLTMSSGFDGPYLMGGDRRKGIGIPCYVTYMMSRPVRKEPGTCFAYSTGDSILAGRMIEKATGQNLGVYLYQEIFSKLGQPWPIWENDPMGHPIGGGGMFQKLTDMMKLGQLYLSGGIWNGETIVDPSWIKEATSKQIDIEPEGNVWRCGYGYQFWMSPYPGSYRADGAYGQITMVLPEKGLVVAIQCPEWGEFSKVQEALHERFFTQL